MPINRIRTILNTRERAIAFFTRGERFLVHPDNTGSTGAWLLSTKKVNAGFFLPITVVVYLRTEKGNVIWHGTSTGVVAEPQDPKGRTRSRLELSDVHRVGIASTNWFDCAQTHRQDFAYFNC